MDMLEREYIEKSSINIMEAALKIMNGDKDAIDKDMFKRHVDAYKAQLKFFKESKEQEQNRGLAKK